jgi:hypothetical protein
MLPGVSRCGPAPIAPPIAQVDTLVRECGSGLAYLRLPLPVARAASARDQAGPTLAEPIDGPCALLGFSGPPGQPAMRGADQEL